MSISSVSSATPVAPTQQVDTRKPDVTAQDDADRNPPPPQKPPLPPGQGTRIDQYV